MSSGVPVIKFNDFADDLGSALGVTLDDAFALACGGCGLSRKARLFCSFLCVANLATYARISMLRLRMQSLIDHLAPGRLAGTLCRRQLPQTEGVVAQPPVGDERFMWQKHIFLRTSQLFKSVSKQCFAR